MTQIKQFTNSRFSVLEYLYSCRDGHNIARVTQSEIAINLDIGRVTINKLVSELRKDGYLKDAMHSWGYVLTPKAIALITEMKKIDQIVNGVDKI